MEPDPLIDEIRRVRHDISAEHGHDTKRYLDHLRELHESLVRSGQFREFESTAKIEPIGSHHDK